MNLFENFLEGLRSVRANKLRSILTASIVAIGIMALVGMLTAVDGIENSVSENMASFGANSFVIYARNFRGGRRGGVQEKTFPRLTFNESKQFAAQYHFPASVSLSARLTMLGEVKRGSLKTNPNVNVYGCNQEYLPLKGLTLSEGRSFSTFELEHGNRVAIIGSKLAEALFEKENIRLGAALSFRGNQFKLIGIIKEKGEMSEDNYDNMLLIPLALANQLSVDRALGYWINVSVEDPKQMDVAMGEAMNLMRRIRKNEIGKENSFTLERSETLAQKLEAITSGLRLGGFGVGFITLLGASIALMNIMLVSVTERTREVGIRKALGATPKRIQQQFIMEAITVCLLGGAAGILLGMLMGNIVPRFIGVKTFLMPWLSMTIGLSVCVIVGLLSGFYPARKASRLDPIESLRFE